MSILVVDNSKKDNFRIMTPKLIKLLTKLGHSPVVVPGKGPLTKDIPNDLRGIILSGGPILLSEKSEILSYSTNINVKKQVHSQTRSQIKGI